MLRRFITQLRHKPKAVRDNIALGVAGSMTAVVVLAWVLVTPENISTVASEARKQPGTFATLFNQIKEQTATVVESVTAVKTAVDEEVAEEATPVATSSESASVENSTITSTSTQSGAIIRIATTTSASSTPSSE